MWIQLLNNWTTDLQSRTEPILHALESCMFSVIFSKLIQSFCLSPPSPIWSPVFFHFLIFFFLFSLLQCGWLRETSSIWDTNKSFLYVFNFFVLCMAKFLCGHIKNCIANRKIIWFISFLELYCPFNLCFMFRYSDEYARLYRQTIILGSYSNPGNGVSFYSYKALIRTLPYFACLYISFFFFWGGEGMWIFEKSYHGPPFFIYLVVVIFSNLQIIVWCRLLLAQSRMFFFITCLC